MAKQISITETTDDLEAWVARSKPGDMIIFHVGISLPSRTGQIAARLRDAGLITTCQKRFRAESSVFEHIAIRRRRAAR